MKIEWDKTKAEINFSKHHVSFEEAGSVLEDSLALTVTDESHSDEEKRYITIGESKTGRLLLVCHTFDKENVRIISARKPTRGERESYENR